MSYILDSIKKSDQERSDINIDTPEQLKTPAYLEAPLPKQEISRGVYIAVGFIMICICLMLVFFMLPKHQELVSTPINVPPVAKPEPATVMPKPIAPVVDDQQNTVVDSLYESRQQQENIIDSEPTPDKTKNIKPSTPISSPRPTPTSTSSPKVTENTTPSQNEPANVLIPSVFSLDAATQRTIPEIKYDAHIYASDNNSGFVILNGAKKQVGDSLRSGIYIEKINQEDVVLSYNGLLFTLPALKSWSYQ